MPEAPYRHARTAAAIDRRGASLEQLHRTERHCSWQLAACARWQLAAAHQGPRSAGQQGIF